MQHSEHLLIHLSTDMNTLFTHSKKLAMLCLSAGLLFPITTQAESELTLGNGRNSITQLQQISKNTDKAGSALYYPADFMTAYKGCTISAIKVGLNTASVDDKDTLRVFITNDLNGKPLYEQEQTSWTRSWNTITLNTPFVIDGQALYIGYEVSGQKFLAYTNMLVENEEWVKCDKAFGWEKYEGEPTLRAALQAVVTGDNLPQHNVQILNTKMPNYTLPGKNIIYSGTFNNLGATTVNSLKFTYLVNGKEFTTHTVSGLNVRPRTTGAFMMQNLILDQTGIYDVQLQISQINGEADAYEKDNATPVKQTMVCDSIVKRRALLEVFSTEKCTRCPSAHKEISKILDGNKEVVELSHHAGFYTDKFTIDESVAYEWFYTPTHGTYAPAMMFDRKEFASRFPDIYKDHVPMIDANGQNVQKVLPEALDMPALTSVNITAEGEANSREVRIHVEGKELLPTDFLKNPVLNVWLAEDHIFTETQAGATGNFTQRHVARRCLTPTWGTPVDLSKGYAADFKVEIPATWNMDNMKIVAFVSNYNADDRNDCQVLNTNELLIKHVISGIDTVTKPGKADSFDVYTPSGLCVLKKASANDLQQLPQGIYIVNGKKWLK